MEEIITNIINNFDWSYMLSVNVLTYSINKLLGYFNNIHLSTGWKKLMTIGVIIVLAIVYYLLDNTISLRILLNSAILAPVAWDYVFTPLFDKLGINYKKLNNNN